MADAGQEVEVIDGPYKGIIGVVRKEASDSYWIWAEEIGKEIFKQKRHVIKTAIAKSLYDVFKNTFTKTTIDAITAANRSDFDKSFEELLRMSDRKSTPASPKPARTPASVSTPISPFAPSTPGSNTSSNYSSFSNQSPATTSKDELPLQSPLSTSLYNYDKDFEMAVELQSEENNHRRNHLLIPTHNTFNSASINNNNNNSNNNHNTNNKPLTVPLHVPEDYDPADFESKWETARQKEEEQSAKRRQENTPKTSELEATQADIEEQRRIEMEIKRQYQQKQQRQQQQETERLQKEEQEKRVKENQDKLDAEVALKMQQELNKEIEEMDHRIALNVQTQQQRQQQQLRQNQPRPVVRRSSLGESNIGGFASYGSTSATTSSASSRYSRAPYNSGYNNNTSVEQIIQSSLNELLRSQGEAFDDSDDDESPSIPIQLPMPMRRQMTPGRLRASGAPLSYEQLTQLEDVHVGMTQQQINLLPSHPHKANTKVDPCSVCLSEFAADEMVTRLPCFHCFHKGCIEKWLKQNKHCPVCKADASAQ